MADPGENLTGVLSSNFGHGGCDGRGLHGPGLEPHSLPPLEATMDNMAATT